MKSTGIVRPIDSVGRVVIPMEIRRQLGVSNAKDSLEVFVEDDKIVLRKYTPSCCFCKNADDLIVFNGQKVCKDCIEKLYTAAAE